MRVVLDTNVLVSRFLSPSGPPAQVFDLWEKQTFQLVVSDPILQEYRRVLLYKDIAERHGLSDEEVGELIEAMKYLALVVNPKITITAIARDPSDNKFLECALAGEAEFIVSGDPHLLDLGRYEGIEIVSPAAFLALYHP